jgi:hypothetical protein
MLQSTYAMASSVSNLHGRLDAGTQLRHLAILTISRAAA